jgi:hypothetical protein
MRFDLPGSRKAAAKVFPLTGFSAIINLSLPDL